MTDSAGSMHTGSATAVYSLELDISYHVSRWWRRRLPWYWACACGHRRHQTLDDLVLSAAYGILCFRL